MIRLSLDSMDIKCALPIFGVKVAFTYDAPNCRPSKTVGGRTVSLPLRPGQPTHREKSCQWHRAAGVYVPTQWACGAAGIRTPALRHQPPGHAAADGFQRDRGLAEILFYGKCTRS